MRRAVEQLERAGCLGNVTVVAATADMPPGLRYLVRGGAGVGAVGAVGWFVCFFVGGRKAQVGWSKMTLLLSMCVLSACVVSSTTRRSPHPTDLPADPALIPPSVPSIKCMAKLIKGTLRRVRPRGALGGAGGPGPGGL